MASSLGLWLCGLCAGPLGDGSAHAPVVFREYLVIASVGQYGRAALHTDAIEAAIVAGRFTPPHASDRVRLPGGEERVWEPAGADANGRLEHAALARGYAWTTFDSDRERIMLLDAAGHSLVYANGEPRAGDPYMTGWTLLPVRLHPGENTFLFACGRGELIAKLVAPSGAVVFNPRDPTLPDLLAGEAVDTWGAVPVLNASASPLKAQLEASLDGGPATLTPLHVEPCALRKAKFRMRGPAPAAPGELHVRLRVVAAEGDTDALATLELPLPIRLPSDRYKRTFVSEIDGSVQYYAVTPAHPAADETRSPALVLTLHGASVEATGQAAAYGHKTWAHIVAPTNRRPYGFDWEDWGRLDALEVLERAAGELKTDPQRTYLTGHSMGGHGVWQLGATCPDRFAALAPSAGWIGFQSYVGAPVYGGPPSIEQMLTRAAAASDTLALLRNYLHHGIYILHGAADDNVPVREARTMRGHLAAFHADFAYYERPDAGHWWGSECVDWPPLFDFLGYHASPPAGDVRHVEFVTLNPGVSASSHWVTIECQQRPLVPASVDITLDARQRTFRGRTENVARLALDLDELAAPRSMPGGQAGATTQPALPPGGPITVELDGQTLSAAWPAGGRLHLARGASRGPKAAQPATPEPASAAAVETWEIASAAGPGLKNPRRYGPFKDAFQHRFVLVYGTRGRPEENAWARAKARFDAETFWYRGNGAPDVLADAEFDPAAERDRGVILYGNADTNAAWPALLGDSPVQVAGGRVLLVEPDRPAREMLADDLACLLVRPRAGSDVALVGAVSGTGPAGMRVCDRLPYFVSGVGYPDYIVLSSAVLTDGAAGIRAAGFFGADWSLAGGEHADAP